jgi:protein-S-isoprenylcysteine O-methyltransferase Ste14
VSVPVPASSVPGAAGSPGRSIDTGFVSSATRGETLRVSLYRSIIAGLWLVFVSYWAVAAMGAKRDASRRLWRGGIGLRLALILLFAVVVRSPALREFLSEAQRFASHSDFLGWAGVALCVLGFGLAISARWYLGRNWGMPMSRKEQPELITSGPYAYIRHPIYTGLIMAMLGSAIGVNIFWALMLVPVGAYFIYSAGREEAVMLRLFPEQYAAYMARTGMLAPRLFPRR